jgi:hypothetical protein
VLAADPTQSDSSGPIGRRRYPALMGLINTTNLRRAKELLEKNRHKVGDVVEKAGDTLDKVSNGKTSSVTTKASDAAKKYSQGATPTGGPTEGTGAPVDGTTDQTGTDGSPQTHVSDSTADALKGAADALTNFLNKAAAQVEQRTQKK